MEKIRRKRDAKNASQIEHQALQLNATKADQCYSMNCCMAACTSNNKTHVDFLPQLSIIADIQVCTSSYQLDPYIVISCKTSSLTTVNPTTLMKCQLGHSSVAAGRPMVLSADSYYSMQALIAVSKFMFVTQRMRECI